MKRMNYSSITSAIRKNHQAKSKSDASGLPVAELLDQDRELRKSFYRNARRNDNDANF
ncbi:MAG: hypothetical protein GY896_01010 [Gammaproteobacteria bacterium]|nr:hypothetical protein [Gammaproteobacteria bacterium]